MVLVLALVNFSKGVLIMDANGYAKNIGRGFKLIALYAFVGGLVTAASVWGVIRLFS